MSGTRHERLTSSFGWGARGGPVAERVLHAIGANPSFTEDVLGDLSEERARRVDADGAASARLWYAREALRAVPHLAWNAARHGGARGRVRVVVLAAGVALVPVLIVTVVDAWRSAPARLVVQGQRGSSAADGFVVNSREVRLAMQAFDSRDRPLRPEVIRYRGDGQSAVAVSPDGVITCSGPGDGALRASAGRVATSVKVRCRPVTSVKVVGWVQVVAGDSAYEVPFEARGPDGARVRLLAGERYTTDSTVARIEGTRIRALMPGSSMIVTRIGDAEAHTKVSVYELVPSLHGLRPSQPAVIAPVRLRRGDAIHWPLPVGRFFLKFHRNALDDPLPRLAVAGPVSCTPRLAPDVDRAECVASGSGATVFVSRPDRGGTIDGRLSLERLR